MKVTAVTPVKHDGTLHESGDIFDIDDQSAQPLLVDGVVAESTREHELVAQARVQAAKEAADQKKKEMAASAKAALSGDEGDSGPEPESQPPSMDWSRANLEDAADRLGLVPSDYGNKAKLLRAVQDRLRTESAKEAGNQNVAEVAKEPAKTSKKQ